MSEENIRQLEDLFDLGDSDVDLEDVYSEDAGDATFDDKKEEINEILSEEKQENGETKKASTKDVIEEAISPSQPVANKEVIDEKESEKVEEKTEEEKAEIPNIVEEESDDEIDFDTTESFKAEESETEVEPVKIDDVKVEEVKVTDVEDNPFVEPKKTIQKVEEEKVIEAIDEAAETKPEPKQEEEMVQFSEKENNVTDKEQHKTSQSTNHWQLTHPDAKFTHFYKMKKERLEKFLADGEVPYNAWKQELVNARVDLSSLVFDLDHLSKQMQQVQQYQYRVAEIRMAVVGQFNWCKRSLEFLRGKLAQIAYERPIEKFNGVVYDHLSDIEDYLQQLEVLKDNSEIVTKNLDKAAEVISRRVTVVMMEVRTDNKGTRYVPREGEQQDDLGSAHVAPMQPANLESAPIETIEAVKEEDPDAEFLDECDVFEANSSNVEKKPKKTGWDLIPGKK